MLKFCIFILTLLCLIGCSTHQIYYTNINGVEVVVKRVIPVYIDVSFSNTDKESISKSINDWNHVFNGQIIMTIADTNFDMQPNLLYKGFSEHAFFILKVASDNPSIPDQTPQSKCKLIAGCELTLAWSDRLGGSIVKVVRDRIFSSNDLYHIMLHELGHLFYLPHTPKKPQYMQSLMYPTYLPGGYLCVDRASVNKVAQIYNLNFQIMNYCLIDR